MEEQRIILSSDVQVHKLPACELDTIVPECCMYDVALADCQLSIGEIPPQENKCTA